MAARYDVLYSQAIPRIHKQLNQLFRCVGPVKPWSERRRLQQCKIVTKQRGRRQLQRCKTVTKQRGKAARARAPLMVPGASSIMMRGGAAALSSRDAPLSALNSNPSTSIFITKKRLHTDCGHGFQASCLFVIMESTAATRTLWITAPRATAFDRAEAVSA